MRLKDKVALVTGANSGIGKAIAERFAAEGAHVAVNYRPNQGHDAEVLAQVQSYPTEAMAVAGDVSSRADMERMVAEVVARFGRIDIAVANAGMETKKPFLDVTDDEWNRVVSIDLFGAFITAQVAARQMVKQNTPGRLIFMSSIHEDVPFPQFASYCAAKGGVRMLMRNLAVELAPNGITANNIAPGAIATPINQATLDDPTSAAAAIEPIPLHRFGKPEEVAGLATYLASDESAYVTGSTFVIDGGLTQNVTKF